MTYARERKDFVAKLRDLDAALQAALIDILDQAAADTSTTQKQKAAIKKLRTVLDKSGYRFDIFFGLRTLAPAREVDPHQRLPVGDRGDEGSRDRTLRG